MEVGYGRDVMQQGRLLGVALATICRVLLGTWHSTGYLNLPLSLFTEEETGLGHTIHTTKALVAGPGTDRVLSK